jgi:hypothetical protein
VPAVDDFEIKARDLLLQGFVVGMIIEDTVASAHENADGDAERPIARAHHFEVAVGRG